MIPGGLAAVVVAAVALSAQQPPQVASLLPASGAVEVDAKKVTTLVVTFDQAMSGTGWSFCGGGPKFPKFQGPPRWKDARTCEVDVALEPDHDYAIYLNCPAGGNFRSARGVKATPKMWTFATLPAKPLRPAEQKALNEKSLDALRGVLESSYSYYDLRALDWERMYRDASKEVLGSASTRAWAAAVARMLEPTQDIHLHLRLGDAVFATGKRAIDPLYRAPLLAKYLAEQRPLGDQALLGRTSDGIGYLMIAGWTAALDLDAVERALGELRDEKALIVDVRPNSGGDEGLAQRIAQWFVDGTRVYAKNRYRIREGENGFGPRLDRALTGNSEREKQYRGPVVVLQSRYVMSSCEAFVLMMRQAPDCTTVGQATYGSSGNPKPHELPNGVTVVVPSWQALLPDGTCFESVGIAPDVAVEVGDADLHTRDPILERALELLRSR